MRPSRLGALALPLVVLTTGVFLSIGACTTKEAPVVKEAKPGRVQIMKNDRLLGVVHITPGAPGRLERMEDSPDAREVEELWIRNKCSESVTVEAETAKDGVFTMGATIVPATSAAYGEQVRMFYISKGYKAWLLVGAAPPSPTAVPDGGSPEGAR